MPKDLMKKNNTIQATLAKYPNIFELYDKAPPEVQEKIKEYCMQEKKEREAQVREKNESNSDKR